MVDLIVTAKELNATVEDVLSVCGSNATCREIALDVYNIKNLGDPP